MNRQIHIKGVIDIEIKKRKINNGKKWEQLCKKYLEKMGYLVIRLQDSPSSFGRDSSVVRFTRANMADYIVYKYPDIHIIECKSFNNASMPFGNIRESQLNAMKEIAGKNMKGVKVGFLVEASRYSEYYYIDIDEIVNYIETSGRKSFPKTFFEEKGYKLIKSKGIFEREK